MFFTSELNSYSEPPLKFFILANIFLLCFPFPTRATPPCSTWRMTAPPLKAGPLEPPLRFPEKLSLTRAWWDTLKPWQILLTAVRFWSWLTLSLETMEFRMIIFEMNTICPNISSPITFTFRVWWRARTRGIILIGRHKSLCQSGFGTIMFQVFTVWIPEPSRKSFENMVPFWGVCMWYVCFRRLFFILFSFFI